MQQSGSRRSFGRRKETPVITIRRGDQETAYAVRPWMFWSAVGGVAAFSALYLFATGYLMFRDEVLGAALRHQIDVETAYEDRIAGLRLQIDRINSRQLLDQDTVEAKVDALMARQTALADAGSRVAGLLDKARAAGVKVPDSLNSAGPPEAKPALPAPIEPVRAPAKASTWLLPESAAPRPASGEISRRLSQVESEVGSHARRQDGAVAAIATLAGDSVRRIETSIARLGLPVAAGSGGRTGNLGGPFVPAPLATGTIADAEAALDHLNGLKARLATLPLRAPLAGALVETSPFGGRNDPFLGVAAIHTGTDFRADQGTPVLATAPGTVSEAGRQGGYGIMVEIEHGGGIATRYGHLSRLAVAAGEKVRTGDVIGYAGSTGRSTGPHLHYETRVNGEAVDPADWLATGGTLRAYL